MFIGGFAYPMFITGHYDKAYIGSRHCILVYDQIKENWESSIPVTERILDIFFSIDRNKLRIRTDYGVREFDENFRDWTPVDSLRYTRAETAELETDGAVVPDRITGLSMPYPWLFMGDAVRDKDMRKALVNRAVVFDYDKLWVLTSGLGLFKGSLRQGILKSVWFGLEDTDVKSMLIHDGCIWFGAENSGGSLIKSDLKLQNWDRYRAGISMGFPNGKINHIMFWKGYYWLATDGGVIRMEAKDGFFFRYGIQKNLWTDKIFCLENFQNILFAGTDKGLFYLEGLNGQFQQASHPDILSLPVYSLKSDSEGVWAATKYGIYKFLPQNQQWINPGKSYLTKGRAVKDVAVMGNSVFWIQENDLLMRMEGKTPAKEMLKRKKIKRFQIEGDYLYGAYERGVFAYNVKNGLSVDFKLGDGIIGNRVNTVAVGKDFIWIATDLGVSRINGKRFLP